MKLKEKLNSIWSINPDQKVRIGASSGWMFFGTQKRFDEYWEKATNRFHDLQYAQQDKCLKRLQELISNPCLKTIECPDAEVPTIDDMKGIKRYADICEHYFLELEGYMSLLNRFISGLRLNQVKYVNSTDYLVHYIPFLDREVVESYSAMNGADICIRVEGNEQAAYWMESEFIYEVVEGNKLNHNEVQ